jgi:HPt (histidine-containing phosphotransfer) domain-containing protein
MMPEMDGIETTKRLRDLGYTAPIVALTANAVAGQADMFLQNGFNEFISKPIDIRQLNNILNKLVRDKQPPEVIEEARRQQGTESSNDSAMQPQKDKLLMESFVHDARKAVTVLEGMRDRAVYENDEGELQKYTVVVHGIKSSLKNIGEDELSDIAFKLEEAGRNHDIDSIAEATPDFFEKLVTLLERLESEREVSEADKDMDELYDILVSLQEACADYDRKKALGLISGVKSCTKETAQVLDIIKGHILHSGFEEAENEAKTYAELLLAVKETDPVQSQGRSKLAGKTVEGLDIVKGLERYDGDEDIYLKVLRSYAATVRSLLDIVETFTPEKLTDYQIKIHGIKGASFDILAEPLGNLALELEKAAKAGDCNYIEANNKVFLVEARELVENVENVLALINAENPKPKKVKPDEESLTRLLTACKEYRVEAVDAAMAEIEKYHYEADEELVEWLREKTDMMKYSQIIEKLS